MQKLEIPGWFKQSMVEMFSMYPGAQMQTIALQTWWSRLGDLPREAIERAMVKASNESPQFAPSAPLVRTVAEPIAKTLAIKIPEQPAGYLPEPELDLPPDNPFYETLERFKRGDIPKREAAAQIARTVAESIAGVGR
jgi:hypothetical protein